MGSDKWKRKTLPTIRTTSPLPIPNGATSEANLVQSKKSRALSKALRSLSNSSIESMSHSPSKSSTSSRRLQKNHSGSGSMLGRLHRKVSKDSPVSASAPELVAPALELPHSAMEILQYGPLKADVSLLKARSEYLVLTDQCLTKFPSIEAAKALFPQLGQPDTARNRSSMHFGNTKTYTADQCLEIPLRSIVAVFNEEGSNPRFGIEVWWFSQWPKLSYFKTHLFFALPNDRDDWLADIQRACKMHYRRSPAQSLIPENLKSRINRLVEAIEPGASESDSKTMTFPVVKRTVGSVQKSNTSEDAQHLLESPSFYIVIGPCMCYFIEVGGKSDYMMMPNELKLKVQTFGTVTLTRFKASIATQEQRFVMSFRLPFGRETRLDLASSHYRRIIEAMTKVDRVLKPMWPQHLQQAIFDVRGLAPPLSLTSGNDLGGLERSLQAYCAAFNVIVPRWTIEWSTPSEPTFRLLPSNGPPYSPLQLLAVFRALRYNSYFKALSFRNVDLATLAGKIDYSQFGDAVAYTSLNGHKIAEEHYDLLAQAPVLTQEVHALAFASESIRTIDLRNIVGYQDPSNRSNQYKADPALARKLISEALRPILMLLRQECCRCHSLLLSDNLLPTADAEELANILVLDSTYLKRLEVANCGLGDSGLTTLWAGIVGQAANLQCLDTSNNHGTVKFDIISQALNELRAIRKLNIAGNTRLAYGVPLFNDDTLNTWELEELDVSGIALNDATVEQIANYLSTPMSLNLRVLRMNNCGLTGGQIAQLFHVMGRGRELLVHVNSSRLDEGIDDLCGAIASGSGPWGLFMQMVEFALEENYIKLMRALTVNKSIECLSLAGMATPDSASERACHAVADFFAENDTVRYLDISGFDAKLDEGRLGRGFSRSLIGLRSNKQLEHLRVRSQMLNVNIGDLAEAIAANKTLHTLDCEGNDFNLSNYRHLVKHLAENSTIRYFSAFSHQELDHTIQKSIDNAVSATTPTTASSRRQSMVISMFRHDKPPPSVSRPLVQQLKDGWDDCVQTRAQIMKRNRLLYEDGEDDRLEARLSLFHRFGDGDEVFSNEFGGLARRAFEAQKAIGRQDPSNYQKRHSIMSLSPSTARLLSMATDSNSRVERSNSNVSSEEGVSPAIDSASTGSAMPTPPELESPVEKEYSLGNEQFDGAGDNGTLDYEFSFLDIQDSDFALEMQAHQRFWSSDVGRIEEEDNGVHLTERKS